ncbi:MAG: ABC transporter ATP-binding protein [Thermodesulfobacteriota bacterium]|nr:ABC transporter ATP-binding protein [Thermodesulfobacteriota bacterium]
MDAIVELKNLSKRYISFFKKRDILAVDRMSLEVKKGEIFGFLGPNGAGKTSTIKLICGLLKPTWGSIFIEGLDTEKHRKKILHRLGAVLEGTRNSHWPLTVKENLVYFGHLKNIKGNVLKRNIEHLLFFLDLQEKADVPVKLLSQGMKQKLAIALALISDPVVVLLDEPTSNLDVKSSRIIKEKIREMADKEGKTIIITTHNMEVAQEVCDRVAIMDQGKIVALDWVENLISIFSKQKYEFKLHNHFSWERLRKFPSIKDLNFQHDDGYNTLNFTLQGTSTLYDIMDLLRKEEVIIDSINKREASLEDIFLDLTR